MSATIKLSQLTNQLLTYLRAVEINGSPLAVGDMEIPPGVGWSAGAMLPGAVFTGYGILVPMTAAASEGDLMTPQADWRIPHVLQYYGATREQCQFIGDELRGALNALTHEVLDLGDARYRVQQVYTDSLGGTSRVPGTNPAYYGAQDQFTLWLARRST